MSPKQEAYATLIETLAMIYPPMVIALYFKFKTEKMKRPAPFAVKQTNTPPTPPAPPSPQKENKKASDIFTAFDPSKIEIPN
ncbi:MAG: hypothetical protein KGJ13_06500 [Patescibacteria group bacterium]|nr:hypothetical protein [Patescibacteria group bacterium]